jgi:hypothetical protein
VSKWVRVILWLAAALILFLCGLAIVLIFPGQPSNASSLRFDGFIVLPKVKNAGALTVLDYLTVFGDDLFVTNVSTGAVYKIALRTRALPNAADVSVFGLEPAAHGVVVDPTSHLAYVTRSHANTVDVFDHSIQRICNWSSASQSLPTLTEYSMIHSTSWFTPQVPTRCWRL